MSDFDSTPDSNPDPRRPGHVNCETLAPGTTVFRDSLIVAGESCTHDFQDRDHRVGPCADCGGAR